MHNQYNHTSNCIFSSFYVGFVITIRPAWLRILACARPSQLAVWATSTARGRVTMLVRCFGTRGFQFWQLMDPSNDRQLHYDLVIIEFIMYSSFSVVSFNVIRTHWAGSVRYAPPSERLKYYVVICAWRVCGARRSCPCWWWYSRNLVPGVARGALHVNDSLRGVVRGVSHGVSWSAKINYG